MNAIAGLRAEHHELEVKMLRLINLVDGFNEPAQATPIIVQLAEVARLLRLHLATEEEWFYPAMIAAEKPGAVSLAATYRDEVGGLAEAVEGFVRRWNSSAGIAAGFGRFRQELSHLLRRIEDRIEREDTELYPSALKLGIGLPAASPGFRAPRRLRRPVRQ